MPTSPQGPEGVQDEDRKRAYYPLAQRRDKGCDSPEAILAVLEKANELDLSQGSDERLTKWLTPTVNILNALSVTLGEGVGTVFHHTQIIFFGTSILLVTYTELPPTVQMTNVMGKIMAEVKAIAAVPPNFHDKVSPSLPPQMTCTISPLARDGISDVTQLGEQRKYHRYPMVSCLLGEDEESVVVG
ncbi:hypothetical protein V8E53_000076 [Lactarius tabidus]